MYQIHYVETEAKNTQIVVYQNGNMIYQAIVTPKSASHVKQCVMSLIRHKNYQVEHI